MSKPLLLFVFMLFNIFTYGSTSDANTADFRNSKPQKGPKPLYGMITDSSKIQRTSPVQHAVQETSSSRLAKAGGYTNMAPKTIYQSHSSRRSASCSIKPPSFFMAAINYIIFGLLLVIRFF
ncbi:hypothetical protein PIB30_030138 [Stylosanthes scabra]|uniref:Uncharacterized protein n=1 Tax=Stylosanthes scabra TaxID=79078 RepID=A0ABU6ZAL5_9FABA|nr:hypothetical protein [Stylosanthes scabra]